MDLNRESFQSEVEESVEAEVAALESRGTYDKEGRSPVEDLRHLYGISRARKEARSI
jgi:hypothetical protein